MLRSFLILIALIIFFSCQRSKYRGYTKTDSGMYYQIHFLGEGKRTPNAGDYAVFDLQLRNLGDTVLIELDSVLWVLDRTKDSCLHDALSMMRIGDSISFIYFDTIFKTETKHIVKLLKLQTPKEYEDEQKYLEWKKRSEKKEKELLTDYLLKNDIEKKSAIQGIYFTTIKHGKGNYIQTGNVITIQYKGYFLDGTLFDSSYEANLPLEFTYGNPDQVIKGIEIGLSMMKNGGKAKIIIPSRLAFGDLGSSSGIVPPFTPVIFEVEVIRKEN